MVVLTRLPGYRSYYGVIRYFGTFFSSRKLVRILALAWILPIVGCLGPRTQPATHDTAEMSDAGFQAYLAEAPYVTVEEAYRAMLILADGEDTCKTHAERAEKLESRGIARAAWKLKPENIIDTGSVSYMVVKICQIRGGINFTLFGSWGLGDRRYAMRELVYRKMLDEAADYQAIAGDRLIGLMARADDLMQKKGLYESTKIDLSDETDRDESGELIVPPTPSGAPSTTTEPVEESDSGNLPLQPAGTNGGGI